MNNKQVEKRLRVAVNNSVPDVFESILDRCNTQERTEVIYLKKSKRFALSVVGVAAAIAIILGGVAGFRAVSTNTVDSVVNLDVNPSIRLEINKNEKIVEAVPLNDDAKVVLEGMDLSRTDIVVGVNAIIGSMLKNGYIDELSNSILLSVDNEDAEKSQALQKKLSGEISALLDTTAYKGAVLSQSLRHEDGVDALAEQYKISQGKAQLISEIIKNDSRYTFEQLAGLSVNELNLLAASGSEVSGNVTASGTASEKKYIGRDRAKEIALAHAKVSVSDTFNYECDLDYENGKMLYEVEFDTADTEYEYDIDAVSGEIVNVETDRYDAADDDDDVIVNQSGEYIGKDRAKEIALANDEVVATDITDYECELENNNGRAVYEIEFDYGNTDYSYEIDAATGDVLKAIKDIDD